MLGIKKKHKDIIHVIIILVSFRLMANAMIIVTLISVSISKPLVNDPVVISLMLTGRILDSFQCLRFAH